MLVVWPDHQNLRPGSVILLIKYRKKYLRISLRLELEIMCEYLGEIWNFDFARRYSTFKRFHTEYVFDIIMTGFSVTRIIFLKVLRSVGKAVINQELNLL